MQATMVNFLELLPVVLVSIVIATFITRESHNGGLRWMDSNHKGRFAMTGPEGSEEDGQRSQEKPGNVSTDGDLVLVVTINITKGRETGFTVSSAPDRDALEAESTGGLNAYEATTIQAREQTVLCHSDTHRWTGLLGTVFNSIITPIVWKPCCSLFHLGFISLKIGFCCAYLFVISAVILLCISTAFRESKLSNKLIQNYFLPTITGMLVYLLGVLVLYAILPVTCMSLVVVYRSITNWFPKMRLTSEETIARCTVELPLRVLSLALAQTMKKRTPAHFVNVNPQYQQQHLHFRRNRRCG
ncbi:uncharacterized protein LOC118409881 [Branchiostoma floridae]|uniref:Uncharacterized protein LOC118409881 n=1 Tax=Branchiostoma floridae TaxID=7739 RepID=A0A9J7MHC8_BRAFL|nr:uncharacterized protein LOC118409881 [Branchiostoma floridae]